WDLKGDNQTITSEVYCQQLTRLKADLHEKNLLGSHASNTIFSPSSLAPTHLHVFRSLQKLSFNTTSREKLEMKLVYFWSPNWLNSMKKE
ncbi:unnamed protein product, partial [Hymenolepis diminuta]